MNLNNINLSIEYPFIGICSMATQAPRLGILLLTLGLAACGGPSVTESPEELSPLAPTSVLTAVPTTPVMATPPTTVGEDDASREGERENMVRTQIEARGVHDPAVLDAMRAVPRHAFVPAEWQSQAYDDHPLPIGYGQTISQPYIVAEMTSALQLTPDMRVLEIGTGSGYQAAILAELVDEVYTVEIIEPLAVSVEARLQSMGYENVHVLRADGYFGWQEFAPYDAILVTAAPDHVPQPLILQMADNSWLVIPVGPVGAFQQLWLFSKADGQLQPAVSLGGVIFVPLTRESSQ